MFRLFIFLFFALIIPSNCYSSKTEKLNILEENDITIQYPSHLSDIAQKIMPQANNLFSNNANNDKCILLKLSDNKEAILKYIANFVGLDDYTERMSIIFDNFISTAISHSKKTTIRLWDKNEVVEYINNNKELPGFTYDTNTGITSYRIDFQSKSNGDSSILDANPIPIVINTDFEQTPYAQAIIVLNAFSGLLSQKLGPGILCHEVAEIAMVSDIGIKGAFTRWFCEGTANLIAYDTLKTFINKESADKFISYYNPIKFNHLKDTTDILGWRTIDWSGEMPPKNTSGIEETAYSGRPAGQGCAGAVRSRQRRGGRP
ncbi:MAG: hypothetical protein SNJ70_09100 [Armatimonadota bacterium]